MRMKILPRTLCFILLTVASHATEQVFPLNKIDHHENQQSAFVEAITKGNVAQVRNILYDSNNENKARMWTILQKWLIHDDPKIREACVSGMRYYQDMGREVARQVLSNDSNTDVRRCAADVLGQIGSQEDIELLADYVEKGKSGNKDESRLASKAISALGSIGGQRAAAIIRDVVFDDSASQIYRSVAILDLGKTGDPHDLPMLDKIRLGPDAYLRSRVLMSFITIAKRYPEVGNEVLNILRESLHDPDQSVRCSAVLGLGSFGGPEDLIRIENMLEDTHSAVRRQAKQSMRSLRIHMQMIDRLKDPRMRFNSISNIRRTKLFPAIPELLELMKIEDSRDSFYDKLNAAETLCDFGNKEWIESIKKLSRTTKFPITTEEKIQIAVLLARAGDCSQFDFLSNYISHADWLFRYLTIKFLSEMSNSTKQAASRAAELLELAAMTDPIMSLRRDAIVALEKLLKNAPDSEPRLLKVLETNLNSADDKLRTICEAKIKEYNQRLKWN